MFLKTSDIYSVLSTALIPGSRILCYEKQKRKDTWRLLGNQRKKQMATVSSAQAKLRLVLVLKGKKEKKDTVCFE
jgi:hypothetical protein